MPRLWIALLALLLSPIALAHQDDADGDHRSLLGFVEWATLEPVGLRLKARLDTGAQTSSLHSVDIETFERDDREWVRFRVPVSDHRETDDAKLQALVMERPVERIALIKRKGNTKSQQRYVVELPFCLNGRSHSAEFSLADRGHFHYPMLLGRHFLADVALVDPADGFLAGKQCEHTPLSEFDQPVLELGVDSEGKLDSDGAD